MEGCCGSLCKMFNECEYLNWEKPALTGGFLAIINIFSIAMATSGMSLFTIFTYFFLFYITAGIVIAQFSEKSKNDDEEYEHISKDQFEKILSFLYNTYFEISLYMKKVNSLSNFYLTAKFYGSLYALSVVSGWFCDCTLIWVGINVLFLWKPIYSSQKSTIDGVTAQAKQAVEDVLNKIDSFIPKYKDSKKMD